jgi:hypothetical protein
MRIEDLQREHEALTSLKATHPTPDSFGGVDLFVRSEQYNLELAATRGLAKRLAETSPGASLEWLLSDRAEAVSE